MRDLSQRGVFGAGLFRVVAAFGVFVAATGTAQAVPSYAIQTGQPCIACHVGGFGPQLTAFGHAFKLGGYTARSSAEFTLPVSGMVMASFVHTAADQPPQPHYAANDNLTLDQANIFLAGGIGDHFGGFAQFTYDGVGRSFSWDNVDLRAVDHYELAGQDLLVGIDLNNSPTTQDAWNTLAAWGFPYTDSDLVPAPAAGTVLDGALAQSVLGVSLYAWWNSEIYAEAGLYWTPGRGFLRAMGIDASEGGGIVAGSAPYLRFTYQKDYGDQSFELGMYALFADLYPGGDRSTGTSDHYRDIGFDASYQFLGTGEGTYQINARYTDEQQDLRASTLLLGAAHPHNNLRDFRLNAAYYYHNTYGGTVGVFKTWGSLDTLLFAGNRTFTPNSAGLMFQIDWTPTGEVDANPRVNVRLGAQYFVYTQFDGASTNYDGLGHNASDNNALRIFVWFAF